MAGAGDTVGAAGAGEVESAVQALRSLLLASHERRLQVAAELGLTVTDTLALSLLAWADQLDASQVALHLGIAPSTTTKLMDRLEAAGLVRRARQTQDRRALAITLTSAGRDVVHASTSSARRMLAALESEQLIDISRCLQVLTAALRAQN